MLQANIFLLENSFSMIQANIFLIESSLSNVTTIHRDYPENRRKDASASPKPYHLKVLKQKASSLHMLSLKQENGALKGLCQE